VPRPFHWAPWRPRLRVSVPQSLHQLLVRPWSQRAVPQSLQLLFQSPCSQWPVPQSLHLPFSRPCSHFPFAALHLLLRNPQFFLLPLPLPLPSVGTACVLAGTSPARNRFLPPSPFPRPEAAQ
jgi:hypothetical protein